jgi:hypothetical protein
VKYRGIMKSKHNMRNATYIEKFLKALMTLIGRKNLLHTRYKTLH